MPDLSPYLLMLDKILLHYGEASQVEKCREELDELNGELISFPDVDRRAVVSEIADVLIMVTQMACVFGTAEVERMIRFKLERQAGRMRMGVNMPVDLPAASPCTYRRAEDAAYAWVRWCPCGKGEEPWGAMEEAFRAAGYDMSPGK